jgi:hypothetical protein
MVTAQTRQSITYCPVKRYNGQGDTVTQANTWNDRAISRHMARRLRPLARRRASTLRPPAVFMRARKPHLCLPFNFVGVVKFFFIGKNFSITFCAVNSFKISLPEILNRIKFLPKQKFVSDYKKPLFQLSFCGHIKEIMLYLRAILSKP